MLVDQAELLKKVAVSCNLTWPLTIKKGYCFQSFIEQSIDSVTKFNLQISPFPLDVFALYTQL